MTNSEALPLYDLLRKKIDAYYQTIWREKWKEGVFDEWLSNFHDTDVDLLEKEKINMLYLLSKFMFFGNDELRQLLLSLYRDIFKYPIIAKIRKSNNDTTNSVLIDSEFNKELQKTRFIGVGNSSESGVHLLYPFRQESGLSKNFFIDTKDIFSVERHTVVSHTGSKRQTRKITFSNSHIKRYIFIDDFCGSGTQAKEYLSKIRRIKKYDPTIRIEYLMLFATEHGIRELNKLGIFDNFEAVFTLDDSFKVFSPDSRYFKTTPNKEIEKSFSETTSLKYGNNLFPYYPLGYKDCQLLIGFSHNTPDNSLPIFWSAEGGWKPIFLRHVKF